MVTQHTPGPRPDGLSRTELARIQAAFDACKKASIFTTKATSEVLAAQSAWDKLMSELRAKATGSATLHSRDDTPHE